MSHGGFVPQRIRLEIGCGPMMPPVLRRVTGMLAAQAGLDVGRVEAALGLAGALSQAACNQLEGSRVSIDFEVAPKRITLQVGPLPLGAAEPLRHGISGESTVSAEIARAMHVETAAESEFLSIGMSDPGVRTPSSDADG